MRVHIVYRQPYLFLVQKVMPGSATTAVTVAIEFVTGGRGRAAAAHDRWDQLDGIENCGVDCPRCA